MRKNKRKILRWIFLFCLFEVSSVFAQNQSQKLWTDLDVQGDLFHSSNFQYVVDIQPRFSLDPDQFEENVIRSGIGYLYLPSISFWAGYQWSSPNLISNSNVVNRLWEQLSYKIIDAPDWNLTSDSRFEERKMLDETGCNNRYRQKLTIKFPNAISYYFIPVVADEIILNITKPDWVSGNTFDQNRGFIGFDIPVSKATYLEIGYLNQYLWRIPENTMNHVLYVGFNINT